MRSAYSKSMWQTVKGQLQKTHYGTGSLLGRNERIKQLWPIPLYTAPG